MYRHILLPVDGSAASERAARQGIALARRLGAKLTVLTVTTPWATHFARELAVVVPDVVVPEGEYEAKAATAARKILQPIADAATAADVACSALHLSHREPYLAIIDAAAKQGCDLVVMGSWAGTGLAGALIGSETAKVLTHSKVPVLVYRQP